MNSDYCTIAEIHNYIKNKKISIPELAKETISKLHQKEKSLSAFISVSENFLDDAEKLQKLTETGEDFPVLTGIPFGLKDNICTKNMRTTCASKMLSDYHSPYTATAAKLLSDSGALLLGKLNMDEFALGSTSETSYFGITKNPWNLSHVPGGSSGGCAAAVASGEIPFALGSDTGGSIRQPAAYCGITGFKPTYGTVSRYGLTAFASSFDQIGPMAHTAEDCCIILNSIAGPDLKDMTVFKSKPSFEIEPDFELSELKLGILNDEKISAVQDSIQVAYQNTLNIFKRLRTDIVNIHLPLSHLYVPVYYILSSAEVSSNLARYDGIRYGFRAEGANTADELMNASRSSGFGSEVKRRILLGTFVLSEEYYESYYIKAQMLRKKILHSFEELFQKTDLLLIPSAPGTAPKIGSSLSDPLSMYRSDLYTVAANLAGLPAISFPCGYDRDGLPIGLQLIAAPGHDGLLLNAVHAFQECTDFHAKTPEVKKI